MLVCWNVSICTFDRSFITFFIQGCGNGKYITLKPDLFAIGCDRSDQICEIAREKYTQIPIIIADNLYLPYRDNLFDAVLSIGVIHHLTTHKRRVQAIQGFFKKTFFTVWRFLRLECLRILNPNGGQLLIYTWAMEQKHRIVSHLTRKRSTFKNNSPYFSLVF